MLFELCLASKTDELEDAFFLETSPLTLTLMCMMSIGTYAGMSVIHRQNMHFVLGTVSYNPVKLNKPFRHM